MTRRRKVAAAPAMANHEPNDEGPKNYSLTRRTNRDGLPSSTVLAAEIDTPFVERAPAQDGWYPAHLDGELPSEAPASAGWRVASLFCGCGGVDLGFRSAGLGVVYANDLYERAAETYEANLGYAVDVRDVREVKALDLGEVDVLTGGFPCVTFSMAGRRAGVVDDANGMLYLQMCRLIDEVRPRYFVAENVKGILSANGGAAVKLVLAAFLRLGYWTGYELVNMADHGVPQTRERVVFIGVRKDQMRGSFCWPKRTHRRVKDGQADLWLKPAVTLREAIGDLPEPDQRERNKYDESRAGHLSNKYRPQGDPNYTIVTGGVVPGNNVPFVEKRVGSTLVANQDQVANAGPTAWGCSGRGGDAAEPGPTVSSNAGSGVPMAPENLRRMTVRECARVQSFPDWFEFSGSMSDGYKQVGNAVPPLYAKRLAEALLRYDERKVL